jgi:hypothetical protein
LHGVNFPASLQTLAFGLRFNLPLQGVNLPALRQALVLDHVQSAAAGVELPCISADIGPFGLCFNQPLQGVNFPASLQILTLVINSISRCLA